MVKKIYSKELIQNQVNVLVQCTGLNGIDIKLPQADLNEQDYEDYIRTVKRKVLKALLGQKNIDSSEVEMVKVSRKQFYASIQLLSLGIAQCIQCLKHVDENKAS